MNEDKIVVFIIKLQCKATIHEDYLLLLMHKENCIYLFTCQSLS